MTSKLLSTVLAGMGLCTLFSCEKPPVLPETSINCGSDYPSHERHDQLQGVLQQFVDQGLPGLSATIETPEHGVWSAAAGFANVEKQEPLEPCNPQYAASILKTYVAVLTLQLIEEGQLTMNTPIKDHVPEDIGEYVANIDQITIEHLLLHNSGLEDNFGIVFLTHFFNDPAATYTTEEFMSYLQYADPVGDPGQEKHHYSDANYMLLSLIIDHITGDHVALMQERIMDELALTQTYYHNSSDYPNPPGLVSSYWDVYGDGTIENVSDYQNNLAQSFYGSGGLIATPEDMNAFIRGAFSGQLLTDQTIQEVIQTKLENDNENWANPYYGYGFMILEDPEHGNWYGHSGRHIGAAAMTFYNPEHDVSISLMTNMGTFFSLKYTQMVYAELWDELVEEAFR